jgi:hypothetical protein
MREFGWFSRGEAGLVIRDANEWNNGFNADF